MRKRYPFFTGHGHGMRSAGHGEGGGGCIDGGVGGLVF
jgi:hypothetical protein